MKLHLVDLNHELVEAWRSSFAGHPEVEVINASILDVATDALVSPANSHGFMDGGIDLVYLRHFGHQLQDRVREAACRRPEEMIPVGAAELIDTGNAQIPYLIVAPTMEMPEPVPPLHARRALAAVLRLAQRHEEISEVYCPGLCTGVGRVLPEDAAREMEIAYREWKKENENRTRRSREPEPAVELTDKSNARGGWLEVTASGKDDFIVTGDLVDTNNFAPALSDSPFSWKGFHESGELGGVKLGMIMSDVVAAWGKPRYLFSRCSIGPRFWYGRGKGYGDLSLCSKGIGLS